MKTDELLQQVKNFDKPQLKEYISNLPVGELIDTMVDMVVNYPQTPGDREQITVSEEVYSKILDISEQICMIYDANFRTPVQGRGRKSIFEIEGYEVAVNKLIEQYKQQYKDKNTPIISASAYNYRLRLLRKAEKQRRINNGEDVAEVEKLPLTYIDTKTGEIINLPQIK